MDSENDDSVINIIGMISIDDFIIVRFFIEVLFDSSFVQTVLPIFSSQKCQNHPFFSYEWKLVLKIIHTTTLTHNGKIVIFNQMEKTRLFRLIGRRRRNSLRLRWLFTISDTIKFSPFLVQKIPRSNKKLRFAIKHLSVYFNISLN